MKGNIEMKYINELWDLKIFCIYYKCNFEQFTLNKPTDKSKTFD